MYNLQFLLSLVSLAAATPVIVNQDGGHYMLQLFSGQYGIDRSDQEISGTSGSGYGGGYGGGYGDGYGGGDLGDGHGGGGFDSAASAGGHLESGGGFDGGHQDYSSGGGFDAGHGGGFDAGHGGDGGHGISLDGGHNYVHSVPVSEHVEVTKPVAVPVYKHIGNVLLHSFQTVNCT